MMTMADCLVNLNHNLDSHRFQGGQYLRILLRRVCDFPPDKASFAACSTRRWPTIPISAGHRGFISRNYFVRRAVLPDATRVDPHHTMAQAANLIELMGDEDD